MSSGTQLSFGTAPGKAKGMVSITDKWPERTTNDPETSIRTLNTPLARGEPSSVEAGQLETLVGQSVEAAI